ncbi:MAG: C40 family peptidase [Taibaiella sp.]|nr:C40 family peptidase [Taibaiella sp.]
MPRTSRDQYSISKKIGSKDELREGDLVFFKIRSRAISHVGIYLADGKFAHASSSKGVVISSLDQDYWSKILCRRRQGRRSYLCIQVKIRILETRRDFNRSRRALTYSALFY